MRNIFSFNVVVFSLVSTLLLTACITTEEKVFTADTSQKNAVESRVNLAKQYLRNNDLAKAKRNLAVARKIDGKSSLVHEGLALVFVQEGELELAEKHFKRAISLDSKFSAARNNYAAFLYRQERYKEAMHELELVVSDELYDKRVLALGNIGLTALKLDDSDKAVSAFSRVLKMDSRNAGALLELASLNYEQKKFKLSSRLYDKYRSVLAQQSARGLLLGVRLAETLTNNDARASYVLALKNLYPSSQEYKRFLAGDYD